MTLHDVLEWLRQLPPGAVYAALLGGALVEYVVPPVPGDTVVVAGAALVAAFDWPLLPVGVAVTVGAVIGSALDYGVGTWLVRAGWLERLKPRQRRAIQLLVDRFHRHGAAYLAVNRFLPGVRAFFFIAAGLAGIRLGAVLFWSAVSATVWNALLIALGYAVGDNIEHLATLIRRHNTVMGALVALVILIVGIRVVQAVRSEE